MNNDKGRINFGVGLDNSLLRTQAAEASNILKGITKSAANEGSRLDDVFKSLGSTIAATFSVAAATEFAHKIVGVRQEIENFEISFRTLLGSEAKAKSMFGEIRRFAVETPMQLKDLASAAQLMLSFNIEDTKILPYLKAIGDVSMGDTQKFQGLALAFSQMSSTGKLMGQDLMQMINAGFNPLAQMAEATGKSLKDLKDEMSAGKISAEMVQQAFLDATSEGGKFCGMLEAQSKGIKGSLSNLQGAIDDMLNDIGTSSQSIITGAIGSATAIVKNYKDIAEAIMAIVASYGAYKAAVMAHEAITANVGAQVVASYAAEQNAINALLVAKQTEYAATVKIETEDLKSAVAKGYLTQAQAEEIAATRLALAQKKEAVIQTELQAKAELEAAVATQTAAKQKLEAAQSNLYAIQAETKMTMAYGVEQEKAAALTKIHAAEKQVESATIAEKVAAEKVETATTELNNATTAKNTLLQGADAVSKGVNATSTNFLTLATETLNKACKKLYAVMAAHPYAIIAAAVTALAYGIYKLATYESEAEKATKRWSQATIEARSSAAEEEQKVKDLFNVLKNAKEGTVEYKNAKKAIIAQYGSYLDGLSKEIQSLRDVEGAYRAVAEAARKSAVARRIADFENTEMQKSGQSRTARYNTFASLFTDDFRKKYSKELYNWANGLEEMPAKVMMYMTNSQMRVYHKLIKEASKEQREFDANLEKTLAENGLTKEDYIRERTGVVKNTKSVKQKSQWTKADWEEEKKTKQAEYEALTKAERNAAKGKALAKEIAEAEKEIQGWNVGASTKQATSAASKLERDTNKLSVEAANRKEKLREYKEEVSKESVAIEFEIAQARIDAMEDGLAKQMAQADLDYKKEIEQVNERAKDMLERLRDIKQNEWENENPNAKKNGKTFDRSSVTMADLSKEQLGQIEELQQIVAEKHKKNVEAAVESEKEALRELLMEYGTYQEQCLALAEDYDAKIAKAHLAGNLIEEKRLKNEKERQLAKLTSDDLAMSIDWGATFGQIGTVLQEAAMQTLAKVEEYMKRPEFKALSATDKKNYYDLRTRLREETGGNKTSPFNFSIWNDIETLTKKYQNSVKRFQEASTKHTIAIDQLKKAQKNLADATNDTEREVALIGVQIAKKAVEITGNEQNNAYNDVVDSQHELSESTDKATNGMKAFSEAVEEMTNGTLSGLFNGILKLIDAVSPNTMQKAGEALNNAGEIIGEAGNALSSSGSKILGIIGAILGLLDQLAESHADMLESTWTKFFDALEKGTIESVDGRTLKASLLPVIQGIGSVLSAAIKAVTFGLVDFDKWFGIGGNAKQIIQSIDSLTKRNEYLQYAVEDLTEEIKKAAGSQSVKAYQEALETQREIEENLLEIARLQASYTSAHHSWNYYWDGFTDAEIDKISEKIGREFSGDLFSLSADEMKTLRDLFPDIWQRIEETGKGGYGSTLIEKLDAYIEQAGKADDLIANLQESLTQISFDNLFDSFIDTLMDMDASAKDVMDDLSEYFMRSMLTNQMGRLFRQRLEDWYENFANAVSDDEFTESERNSLQEQYMAILEEAKTVRDQLAEATGYTSESSREADQGGITTASQDSVDELNARITTIQGHTYDINATTKGLLVSINAILQHVMNIDTNTASLKDKVEDLDTGVKSIRANIEDIAIKGVKLK